MTSLGDSLLILPNSISFSINGTIYLLNYFATISQNLLLYMHPYCEEFPSISECNLHTRDQSREVVNSISEGFYHLADTCHCITLSYHPQANGLVQCQTGQRRTPSESMQMKVTTGTSYWMAYTSLHVEKSIVQLCIAPFHIMCNRGPMRSFKIS